MSHTRTLISWVGLTDLAAPVKADPQEPGPVLRLLRSERFDRVWILNDFPPDSAPKEGTASVSQWRTWVLKQLPESMRPDAMDVKSRPALENDYGEAFRWTSEVLPEIIRQSPEDSTFEVLLSPGQPAATSALVLCTSGRGFRMWSTWRGGSKRPDVEEVHWPWTAEIAQALADRISPKIRQVLEKEATALGSPSLKKLVGNEPRLRLCKLLAAKYARSKRPVLLLGETGTGKELLAQAIHELSERRGRFVPINCAAIPSDLMEVLLFGTEEGVHNDAKDRPGHVEEADKGTLFLDEIGELPPSLQSKLLRVLEEGSVMRVGTSEVRQVDVRLVAATSQPLLTSGRGGLPFRSDLLHRLANGVIELPPLRARLGDVRLLVEHVRAEACKSAEYQVSFSEDALRAFERRFWPGNVRELRNHVQRLVDLGCEGVEFDGRDVESTALHEDWPPQRDADVPRGQMV